MELLAEHPGEHNARRRAKIRQAEANNDVLASMDARYDYPPLKADGAKCQHRIDHYLPYPDEKQVAAIHRSLALAYSVQNNKVMSYAMDATAWDAFVAYDASRMAVAA